MSDTTAAEFDRLLDQYGSVGQELTPLARRMAFETVAKVLPGTHAIRVNGSMNEDWLRVLRVRQVFDADGGVLFDVDEGHDDEAVELAIDLAGTEYLDLLMDLTGDEYLGSHELVEET
jgi:hypothetical protein